MTSHFANHASDADSRWDAVLDDFDAVWNHASPPSIEHYLQGRNVVAANGELAWLLRELISIDLERRWRTYYSHTGISQPDASSMPTLETYLERFPVVRDYERDLVELIAHEFRVRHCWGDKPALPQYRRRFSGVFATLESALYGVLDELLRIELKIYSERQLAHTTVLSRPLELGRQRSSEPAPFYRQAGEQRDRLIIVTHDLTRISRSHLEIDRTNQSSLCIRNCAGNGALALNGDRLEPGVETEIQLPVLIELGSLVIRLEAAP